MKWFSILFVLCFVSGFAYGQILIIDDYLDMVIKNNSELKSIQTNINAIKNKLVEIERAYTCFFSAGLSYSDDKSGRPYTQFVELNEVSNWNYNTFVNKQFETGTQFSLGVNGTYAVHNVPRRNVSDISPFVRLQQSLWKDINGSFTKANISKQKASAKSALYLLEYKKQKLLLDAKNTYWNLSYTRTVIDFRKTSLDRKERLLDWNQRRCNMDLAEKSDLFQSQVAVKFAELNLKLAYEEEDKANRVLNQFLNIKDAQLRYDVEKFEESDNFLKITGRLQKKNIRADVLAALENVNIALYDQKSSQKNSGADLVLEGKYLLNGVEQSLEKSFGHIKNNDRPSYFLGLKYTLPLDFKLRKAISKGYEDAKVSAQSAAESAIAKENNDWIQLLDNWNNARIRMELAVEIEKIQKQRCEEDRNLLRRGRTTTYMVLQSEEDLDTATLNILKVQLELTQINEEVKAFYSGIYEVP